LHAPLEAAPCNHLKATLAHRVQWCVKSRTLRLLEAGMEADLVVLDLASTPVIEQATARAEDVWGALFPTIMLGDDRAVTGVWVGRIRIAKGR